MEKVVSEPNSTGGRGRPVLLPKSTEPGRLAPPSPRSGHCCQLPSTSSPLTHQLGSCEPPVSLPGSTLLPSPDQRGCSLSVRRQGRYWASLSGPEPQVQQENPDPSGAPVSCRQPPGAASVSLEPLLLSGCPTRPRQHPEVRPHPMSSFV